MQAIDGGRPRPLTGSTEVVVMVTDIDDNDPVFTKERFTFSIDENVLPPSYVGQVIARDLDSPGQYSTHVYKFTGDTGDHTASRTFHIDSRNGEEIFLFFLD